MIYDFSTYSKYTRWSHIIGNMIFLWAFAPEIEDAMGRGATLFSICSAHSTVPNLGAGGAIAAVMGAFMGYLPSGSN